MKTSHALRAALPIALFTLCVGCATNTRSTPPEAAVSRVDLTLEPSTRTLLVGEIVTITARTQDTYGRDSQLNWTSTSGKLTTEQNGRVARVRFDEPGTFTVAAVMLVDGKEIRHESVEVVVKPLS